MSANTIDTSNQRDANGNLYYPSNHFGVKYYDPSGHCFCSESCDSLKEAMRRGREWMNQHRYGRAVVYRRSDGSILQQFTS